MVLIHKAWRSRSQPHLLYLICLLRIQLFLLVFDLKKDLYGMDWITKSKIVLSPSLFVPVLVADVIKDFVRLFLLSAFD